MCIRVAQGRPPRGSPPSWELIPSTSTSSLSWTGASCCRSYTSSCPAVRTYVVVVSFLFKGPEVNEVASDFQNGGFTPPGFYFLTGRVLSRYAVGTDRLRTPQSVQLRRTKTGGQGNGSHRARCSHAHTRCGQFSTRTLLVHTPRGVNVC